MNKWMEYIKMTLHYFAIVNIAVMFAAACFIECFYGKDVFLNVNILWQILSVSFLTSLSYLFFYQKDGKELGKKQFWIRFFVAYLYVNVIVLGLGILYKWFSVNSLPMVIGMVIAIIGAYLIICGFIFCIDLKTTEQINAKLRERNGKN